MTKLTFHYFMNHDEGKMARMTTSEGMEIPVNIFIDNAADVEDFPEGPCCVDICGVSGDLKIYASEEEFRAVEPRRDVTSMIPIGTFPADGDDKSFKQSPDVLLSGKVLDVGWDPDAGPDEPNCCLVIRTLEMEVNIYLRNNKPVEEGYIVCGSAWMFGGLLEA